MDKTEKYLLEIILHNLKTLSAKNDRECVIGRIRTCAGISQQISSLSP